MNNEIKELFNKSRLFARRLSKSEVEELKEKYTDGHFPENIKTVMNDYYYSPVFDDFTDEERNLFIQLRSFEKLSKIESHLHFFKNFFVFLIIIYISILIMVVVSNSR